MKKGVTPVIATILLVLITISLTGFAFMWFGRTIESAGTMIENQTTNTIGQAGAKIKVEGFSGNEVYIRNTGTTALSNIGFYINNVPISSDNPVIQPGTVGIAVLNAGQLSLFSGDVQLTVTGPGGVSDMTVITIGGAASSIIILSPASMAYPNSTASARYYSTVSANACKLELDSENMSYPYCSNTTLTYVHYKDSKKILAFDFSEGLGTTAYNKGSLPQNGSFSGTPSWSTGKYGSALTFNSGDTGYVYVSVPSAWNANQFFSVGLWMRATNWNNDGGDIISRWLNAQDSFRMYTSTAAAGGGGVRFALSKNCVGTSASLNSNTNVSDTSWHFIVGTFDGSAQNMSLYVDGVLENSTAFGQGSFCDVMNTITIGKFNDGTNPINATIDELFILNRTLSSPEVFALYRESAFSGAHTLKAWVNSSGVWDSSSVSFTVSS